MARPVPQAVKLTTAFAITSNCIQRDSLYFIRKFHNFSSIKINRQANISIIKKKNPMLIKLKLEFKCWRPQELVVFLLKEKNAFTEFNKIFAIIASIFFRSEKSNSKASSKILNAVFFSISTHNSAAPFFANFTELKKATLIPILNLLVTAHASLHMMECFFHRLHQKWYMN